ncbi:MAG: P-loop NTPase fold protein [Spirulina sp.]
MAVDIRAFYRAVNPTITIGFSTPEDRRYYIDFSEVRGVDLIAELKTKITFFSPDEPTCTLFTGYIGCGKSTELLRLQRELESEKFHVVYFESSEDLEMADVDISDVLLAIARQLSQSLEGMAIPQPKGFLGLLQGVTKALFSEVDIKDFKVGLPSIMGLPEVKLATGSEGEFSLALGIAEINARVKGDPRLRQQLNLYLGSRTSKLIETINTELIAPAIAKLKQQGKAGLVVIVDNLDRIAQREKSWGRPQAEYLFVDRGADLRKLACHLVYTMPLALKFSNEFGNLAVRFGDDPLVLPMVPPCYRDEREHEEGMALLRQMVLARALPEATSEERLAKSEEIFASRAVLDRLCRVSGGHPRDILILLSKWIHKEMKLPLSGDVLEKIVRDRRNELRLTISDAEWELLRQVKMTKKVSDDLGYQILIKSRFVFEYRDRDEWWFEVNPLLAEAPELQS